MDTLVFPGSFDPFTIGHASIVERALPMCRRLVIAVGTNPAKDPGELAARSRTEHIAALYSREPRVEVVAYRGLTVDLCRRLGAGWMLRGVRSVADFEYERNLADVNRTISGIETLLLCALPQYSFISSSMVRELASHGHDTTPFTPTCI